MMYKIETQRQGKRFYWAVSLAATLENDILYLDWYISDGPFQRMDVMIDGHVYDRIGGDHARTEEKAVEQAKNFARMHYLDTLKARTDSETYKVRNFRIGEDRS